MKLLKFCLLCRVVQYGYYTKEFLTLEYTSLFEILFFIPEQCTQFKNKFKATTGIGTQAASISVCRKLSFSGNPPRDIAYTRQKDGTSMECEFCTNNIYSILRLPRIIILKIPDSRSFWEFVKIHREEYLLKSYNS